MAADMEFMNRIFHAALRRDLTRMINVFTGANDHARPERRAALAEHVGLVLDLLHHHHTGEDTGLWPLVRRFERWGLRHAGARRSQRRAVASPGP